MCLCNGTGGITIQHSWGVQFEPCPDSNCDFDRETAWQKTQVILDRLKREVSEVA